jgi:microcystin-dependent protein
MEGTIGEIRMFAGNFAPLSWSFCNGAIIAIQSNSALFSILGTTYGGNGTVNFGLPDLQGRVPVGAGAGAGLPIVDLGDKDGAYQVGLTINELPPHIHTATATVTPKVGTGKVSLVSDPTNNYMGQTPAATPIYTATPTANVFMGSNTANVQIGLTGSGLPFSLMQPYVGLNYIICMYGTYPSRN